MMRTYMLSIFLTFLVVCIGCNKSDGNNTKPIVNPPVPEPELPVVSTTFTNPIWGRGADPWVVYENGKYYFTYTAGNELQVYAVNKISDTLKEPNAVIHSKWRPPTGTEYSKELWAPELHKINGKWYAYIAADDGENRNHRMYVLEYSASVLQRGGDWVFKGKMTDPTDNWAIDGTILEHNGQLYTIWSGWSTPAQTSVQNLYIAKMSNPWTIEGSRVLISAPQYSWERHGSAFNEGPAILKNKNGEVFLTFSGSGYWVDDYCLGLMKLKKEGDPMKRSDWEKYPEPVFTRNDAGGAFGPGHNGFFKSPDGKEDWIIYHARSLPNGGSTNYRNTRIQKVNWKPDGTPDFGEPVKIGEKIQRPSGE